MMVLRFVWISPLLLGVLSLPSPIMSSTTGFKEDRQSCHIFNSGHSANCVGKRLDRIPWMRLPSTLVEVDLSYNELSAVLANDFSHLPNLQILQLQYNNISLIEDDAFKFNPLLEHLDLFNNSLREIPARALQPLTNLKNLLMSNNMYRHATLASSFSRFLHLKSLSMGGPLVEGLKKGDFHPMKNIKLQNFAIKCSSNLSYYELGSLDVINTQFMGLDMAIDQRPNALTMMLQDLANKTFAVLQFRNLFEFMYYVEENDIFSGLKYINAHQLIFHRGKYNENLLRMALVNLQLSPVKMLRLQYIDFARSPTFEDSGLESSVTNLALDRLDLWHISNPDILRFDWRFTWFSKIRHLSIQNVNFNFVPCDAWLHMGQVEDLDVSNNRLFDNALFNQRCEYFGTMPSLRYFDLSTNYLTSLRDLSLLTGDFGQLHVLDVSNNQLGSAEKSKNCDWKQNITHLIAHHNPFENDGLQCLPTTVQVLDLSYCDLDQLDINYFEKTTSLKELLLSGNKIKFIPSDWKCPSLQSLALDGNSFGLISMASFQKMPQLSQLRAGNNPYHCTCDLHTFIQDSMSKGKVNITDWPINYKCYHPEALLNTLIAEYFPGHVACDIRLVVIICVVVTATVVLLLMLLCYKFNVAWYIRATYQIIRAKYRAHKEGTAESQTFAYDAFISYSHYDADWVREELLPCLETSKPPYNLCIHERDFMPGKWIIDNIIENIEHSGKVIFVLSRHFVDSEWCNYELYFAQQRAIGKTFSDVILVVKEPIDPKSLPSKYCKLKKMLYTKTYIEWPQQANQQVFFWAQLKSVLGKPFLTRKQEAVSVRRTVSSVGSLSIIELPLEEEKPQIALTQPNGKEELQTELSDECTEIVVQRSHPLVSQWAK